MISESEYLRLRSKYDTFEAARKAKYGDKSYPSIDNGLPESPSNDETSAIEVREFCNDKPARYFAYVDQSKRIVTTWTGEVLGNASFGAEYRSNMGDKRIPLTVKAVNGLTYHGVYFASAGDYCRLKASKQ